MDDLTNGVTEKCFYSFKKHAWHDSGIVSDEPHTAEEALNEPTSFAGGFNIGKRPVTITLNGLPTVLPGEFYLVREASVVKPEEAYLDRCTDHYTPLQPADVCRKFDENVKQPVETLGFLGEKGSEMFLSWKLPTVEITLGDFLEFFGIVRVGFTPKDSARLFTASYRPVCRNTVNLAEGWAANNTTKEGAGYVWKGKAINPDLITHLGYWMAHVQDKALAETNAIATFFKSLAATPIASDDEAKTLLWKAYPNKGNIEDGSMPSQLITSERQKIADYNETQETMRNGILRLFLGAGTAIKPTLYGLLCACSEYYCHYQPSKKPIAESVMWGPRYNHMLALIKVLAGK